MSHSDESYLFLDIDGVLNSEISYGLGRTTVTGVPGPENLDARACGALAAAQKRAGFSIVISSTWRHLVDLPKFQEWFVAHDIVVSDVCPSEPREKPGAILRWLGENGNPSRYVVVDDEERNVAPFSGMHGVLTNPKWGLTKGQARRIAAALRSYR